MQLVRSGGRVFRAYDVRGYSGLYYYGLSRLTSQEACILNYLWPMMIVLFSALLLGEKVTVRTAAALLPLILRRRRADARRGRTCRGGYPARYGSLCDGGALLRTLLRTEQEAEHGSDRDDGDGVGG